MVDLGRYRAHPFDRQRGKTIVSSVSKKISDLLRLLVSRVTGESFETMTPRVASEKELVGWLSIASRPIASFHDTLPAAARSIFVRERGGNREINSCSP